jgi:hypothetical protein
LGRSGRGFVGGWLSVAGRPRGVNAAGPPDGRQQFWIDQDASYDVDHHV